MKCFIASLLVVAARASIPQDLEAFAYFKVHNDFFLTVLTVLIQYRLSMVRLIIPTKWRKVFVLQFSKTIYAKSKNIMHCTTKD